METRRAKRRAIPVLPEELLLWDILLRLPAEDFVRCGAVCRCWRRLTTDPEFLLARHRRQPSLPLLFFLPSDRGTAHVHGAVDALDTRRTPAVRRPVLGFEDYSRRRGCTIHASCDGLLLLSLGNYRFYLCNPATRQWCALPDLTGGDVAALYPHRPSGEYRVLYSKQPRRNWESTFFHVLTVSSSGAPRCIGRPVASPSSMKKFSNQWFIRGCNHPPVLLHDCLHWHLGSNFFDGKVLVVFDTVVESFRLMQSPVADRSVRLLEMDGMLGVNCVDSATTMAELWVLQDYGMGEWSLKYRVELSVAELKEHVPYRGDLRGNVVSENGDMLVSGGARYSRVFHCDSNGKLLKKYQWQGFDPRVLGLCFKESLIRHAFFQRKDGRPARVPRFFRGL